MNDRNKGVIVIGIINGLLALAVTFLLVIIASGCISFKGKGVDELMLDRGKRICEDTNGMWVNYTCDYSNSPQTDTTVAMLGVQT